MDVLAIPVGAVAAGEVMAEGCTLRSEIMREITSGFDRA